MSDGARRVGEYEILAELSEGGMGEVLLARRRGAHGFEKLVALKTIRAALRDRDDYRTMFLDEARLVAQLHHPAIAQVSDFGETEGQLFLAMEYVAGLSFADLRKREKLPPPGVVARAMVEICRGLHAAHEATDLEGRPLGVVHRDVSPQNLVLTFEGRAKILDFGIARAEERETPETQLGLIKGKPAYMSPEQLLGRRVDRRADVFAAGVVLHEMLTGQRLFRGASMLEVADQARHMRIPAPSEQVPDLPTGLDEVVLAALERDLDARTPDAESMAVALERIAHETNAESLEVFAGRELADAQQEHRLFLRDAATASATTVRRADEPTLRDDAAQPETHVSGEVAAVATTATVDFAASRPIDEETDSTEHALVAAGLSRRKWPLVVGLLAVGALVAGGAWMWRGWQTQQRSSTATSPEPALVPSVAAPEEPTPDSEIVAEPVEPSTTQPKKRTGKRRGRKAKTKAVAASESNATGLVKVTSDPFYANVRIDGRAVGPTPLVRHSLSVGRHVVEIVAPDTGKVIHRQVVEITEAAMVQVAAPR